MIPRISIIVPVYKAESYLQRCVDSLLAQTFQDIEILLVDDGSPDKSGEICDEYANRDKRVRVFHKPNGGVSSARQKGLDEARGEYVIHADPDDWVEPDMLAELYKKAKEENADMVICDFYENKGSRQTYCAQKPSALDHETVLCDLFQHLHGSCWNKLVKRACVKKYNVSFSQDLSFCEDLFFNASLLKNEMKIAYVAKAFYHYDTTINECSLVRKVGKSDIEYRVKLAKKMDTLLMGSQAGQFAYVQMRKEILNRAFSIGLLTSKEFKQQCFSYRKIALKNENFVKGMLQYFACVGFYRISRKVWNILKCFNKIKI